MLKDADRPCFCFPGQVEQMAKHFNVAEDVSYTCESAAHFWLLHVLARWEKFQTSVLAKKTPECVKVSGNASVFDLGLLRMFHRCCGMLPSLTRLVLFCLIVLTYAALHGLCGMK